LPFFASGTIVSNKEDLIMKRKEKISIEENNNKYLLKENSQVYVQHRKMRLFRTPTAVISLLLGFDADDIFCMDNGIINELHK
jgi:hypothetical protein